jgi:hypothetical protein
MAPTLLIPGRLKLGAEETPSDEVPIDYIISWFKQREYGSVPATMDNRVLIVRARTGSGKSTVLPVAVFRLLRDEKTPISQRYKGPSVICTQPRVLTAISLANDVSSKPWNPDMVLGVTVGFQTGELSNKSSSGLLYATAGVLAAQLKYQEDVQIMKKYRFIIVDEAHDRSLDSDQILSLIKNFYQRNLGNKALPYLIITSATFDTVRYADYLGVSYDNILNVTGQTFPIQFNWPQNGTNNYPQEAANVALKIHMENLDDDPKEADILIFMPGAFEMKTTTNLLKRKLDRGEVGSKPFLLLSLDSNVVNSQGRDFNLIFAPIDTLPQVSGKQPIRRIITSTTVAETGLTIDTLKYVIECGWSRTKECYQPYGAEGLITRPAPQNRIEQRRGRVGRLFPGQYYPLYTEKVFNMLDPQQLPDIITLGPNAIYLAIVCEQQRQKFRMSRITDAKSDYTGPKFIADYRVEDITLLDPPPPEALVYSNSIATTLGFISMNAPLPSKKYDPFSLETLLPVDGDDAVVGADSAGDAEVDGGATTAMDAITRGCGLTSLGFIGAAFARTPMEGVRILLSGYVWDVASEDLITAVAMIGSSISDLLVRGKKEKADMPFEHKIIGASLPIFLYAQYNGDAAGGGAVLDTDAAADDGVSGTPSSAGAVGGAPYEKEVTMDRDEEFYFRTKLLIGDNFAEAVFIVDAFIQKVSDSESNMMTLISWCESMGLSFDAMIELLYKRDSIIDEMIVAGLNPYRLPDNKFVKSNAGNFVARLRNFKRCIYDGFQAKMLVYDPKKSVYVSAQGLQVKVPNMFSDVMMKKLNSMNRDRFNDINSIKPKMLCTDSFKLNSAPMKYGDASPPLLYSAEAGMISVMDGFVDPNYDFPNPRSV